MNCSAFVGTISVLCRLMILVALKVARAYFGFGASLITASVVSWPIVINQQLNPITNSNNIFFISPVLVLLIEIFIGGIYLGIPLLIHTVKVLVTHVERLIGPPGCPVAPLLFIMAASVVCFSTILS